MNIKIVNRQDIHYGFFAGDKAILISICVPDLEYAEYCDKYTDVLQLKFHDIDRPTTGCEVMMGGDAMRIAHFVDKYKNEVDTIVVNCDAGQSRSAGCAAAIAKMLNNDDSEIFKTKPALNRHVYSMVFRALQALKMEEDGSKNIGKYVD